jgi:hypothetical protein
VADQPAARKPGDASAAAVEQLRSTAKWLATALAGIAGVLLAGLQLTSLGKADNVGLAALGGGVALVATGWAIWRITRVLTPVTVSLSELPDLIGKTVAADRTLLKAQGPELKQVLAKYEAEYDVNVNAWNDAQAHRRTRRRRQWRKRATSATGRCSTSSSSCAGSASS